MIINGLQTRRIASQEEFSFDVTSSLSNVNGLYEFGFSGDQGVSKFSFESGRVKDFEDKFVWGYRSGESIRVSGNVTQNYYNYWINGTPICLGNKSTGFYDHFYYKTEGVLADSSMRIVADQPNYSFEYLSGIVSGSSLEINLYNNETNPLRKFSVFSGLINANTGQFNLSGLSSVVGPITGNSGFAKFFLTPNNLNFANTFSIPITFYTDFGQINNTFNFNYYNLPLYFFDFFTNYTGLGFDATGGSINTFQYELDITNQSGLKPLYVSLFDFGDNDTRVSGQYDVTGTLSTISTSYIVNSGIVSGIATGIGYSTVPDWNGNYIPANIASELFSNFQWATGDFSVYRNFDVSGFLTGGSPSGTTIPATGTLVGLYTGYINGSGLLYGLPTGFVSGYYFRSLNKELFSSVDTVFQYATGNFIYSFITEGTGLAGFTNYYGNITGSTGVVIQGSIGTRTINSLVTGNQSILGKTYKITPIMSATGLPFGLTSSNIPDDETSYVPFNNDINGSYIMNDGTGFIDYYFGPGSGNVRTTCSSYGLYSNSSGFRPTTFAISGSNDGISWTNLDTQTSVSLNTTDWNYFNISSSQAFDHLRLIVYQAEGSQCLINQIRYLNINTGQMSVSSPIIPRLFSSTSLTGTVFSSGANDDFSFRPWYPFDRDQNTRGRFSDVKLPAQNIINIGLDGSVKPAGSSVGSILGITGDANYNYWYGNFVNIFGVGRGGFAITDKQNTPLYGNYGIGGSSNPVNSVALSGTRTFIGGDFTVSGKSNLLVLDNNTTINNSFASFNGKVTTVKIIDNNIFVGGDFTTYGTTGISGLAMLNSDGSINTGFNLAFSTNDSSPRLISDVEKIGNDLYVVGDFRALKYRTDSFATYMSTNGTGEGGDNYLYRQNVTINGTTYCVTTGSSGRVFVGGDFSNVSGLSTRRAVCAFDSNMNLLPFNVDTNGSVYSVHVSGETLFIGGTFTSINGTGRNRLAAIDISNYSGPGILVTGFAPDVNSHIVTIAHTGDQIYFGGVFSSVNGSPRSRFASVDLNGNLGPINLSFDGEVRAIMPFGNYIYVGGLFNSVSSIDARGLMRMDIGGGISDWAPNTDFGQSIYTLTNYNNSGFIAAGSADNISGQNHVALFDINANLWSGFTGRIGNGTVLASAVDSKGIIYLGGDFTDINNNSVFRRSCSINNKGDFLGWSLDTNGSIWNMTVNNDKVISVGQFTNAGVSRRGSLNCDFSGNVKGWSVFPSNSVSGIHVSNNNAYVFGRFKEIRGITSSGIAIVDTVTGLRKDSSFGMYYVNDFFSDQASISSIVEQGGNLYIGGNYCEHNGSPIGAFNKYSMNGVVDADFSPNCGNVAYCSFFDGTSGWFVAGNISGYGKNLNVSYRFSGASFAPNQVSVTPYSDTPISGFTLYGSSNSGLNYSKIFEVHNAFMVPNSNNVFDLTGVTNYNQFKWEFDYPSGATWDNRTVQITELQLYNVSPTGTTVFTGFLNAIVTGSGTYSRLVSGLKITTISDPTGLQPAFGNAPFLLNGTINDGSGSFLFNNLVVTGAPMPAYLSWPTGDIRATGWFNFLSGDNSFSPNLIFTIGNQNFYYSNAFTEKPFYFSGINDLIDTINSGVTGAYGNNYTGVNATASRMGNYMILSGYSPGTTANSVATNYFNDNLNLIRAASTTLKGGQFFYKEADYTAPMTGLYNSYLYINSGFYSVLNTGFFSAENYVSGLLFVDSFERTWTGSSGFSNNFIGLNYNSLTNAFEGFSLIDSGVNLQAINFEFYKSLLYNQLSGHAIYLISGQGFTYSGIIGT